MSRRSLRARILIGASLWTVGFFFVSGIVMMWMVDRHPHVPNAMHHIFRETIGTGTVAVVLLVVGFLQVRRGLASLADLRTGLLDVHAGRARRLTGDYPTETQPLVNDLNALLDQHEQNVARAQAKAGDLAHGLKTPLAVLAQEADRARGDGQETLAATVADEVARMRRQIDYHLAHARAAASSATPGLRTNVAETVSGLVRTLQRLHADRGLVILVNVPADQFLRVQREDLDEMLGNLLDNACKWAKSRVIVGSTLAGPEILVTIDDDGPGLDVTMREAVLQRGVRADQKSQTAGGAGLGLAIVVDLAALYGGSIELKASPEGGLRATLSLKSA